MKKARESQSFRKNKILLPTKTSNHHILATIHLLKESQYYDSILEQIMRDIRILQHQVGSHSALDEQTLEDMISLERDMPA